MATSGVSDKAGRMVRKMKSYQEVEGQNQQPCRPLGVSAADVCIRLLDDTVRSCKGSFQVDLHLNGVNTKAPHIKTPINMVCNEQTLTLVCWGRRTRKWLSEPTVLKGGNRK
jgi:hypothetical protein